MIKINRNLLTFFAFIVFIAINFMSAFFYLVPLIGVYLRHAMKFDDLDYRKKKRFYFYYVGIRLLVILGFILVFGQIDGGVLGNIDVGLIALVLLLPVALLEGLYIFYFPLKSEFYANYFVATLSFILHMVAVVLFYYSMIIIMVGMSTLVAFVFGITAM